MGVYCNGDGISGSIGGSNSNSSGSKRREQYR